MHDYVRKVRLHLSLLQQWRDRCLAAARQTLGDSPGAPDPARYALEFRDEQGHQRASDPHLIGFVLGIPPATNGPARRDDAAFWYCGRSARDPGALLAPGPAAPLLVHAASTSIEVWTESELSALQALWAIGVSLKSESLQDRAIGAAMFHVEHSQPDNATHHAWGVNVFILTSVLNDCVEARMYAETLLHNCQVGFGKPDARSAWALLEAGRQLDAACRTGS